MKRPLCNDYLTFLNVRARHSPGLTFNSDCRLGEDDDSSSSSESLAAAAEEESYLDKLNAGCESTPSTPYATTPSRDAPAHAENISDARPLHSRGVCAGLENGGDPASGGEGLENGRSLSVAPLGNCTGAACGDATLQCDKPLAPAISDRRESRNLTGLDGLCLGKQLGVGAFGTVYECQWRDKKFAVKQFRADRMGKENARREIQVLKHIGKSVRCPGVSQLQHWRRRPTGEHLLFFAPYASDLLKFLRECNAAGERVSVQQAMHIAASMCEALAFLHAARVIHRDLKPSNILLRRRQPAAPTLPIGDSSQWLAVVADFGNSAVVQEEFNFPEEKKRRTLTWAASGARLTRGVTTLCYAAPEMLVPGETYAYPADVWSFGVVMLEVEATTPLLFKGARTTKWEQLLEIVAFLQPVAAKASLAEKAHEHLRKQGSKFYSSAGQVRKRHAPVGVYGSKFHAWAARCVAFEPGKRVSAQGIHEHCQQCVSMYSALPSRWVFGW